MYTVYTVDHIKPQVLEGRMKLLGESDPATLTTLNNLGGLRGSLANPGGSMVRVMARLQN